MQGDHIASMIRHTSVALLSLLAFVAAQRSDLVVKTNHFTVRGAIEANTSETVRVFRQISYAEPPLGTQVQTTCDEEARVCGR